ncbi:AraC family transcriptional regulator ligand-binding domain-containing protein, partial [Oleiphilus sp. HI0125]
MSISKEQLQHLSPSIHPSYARLLAGHCRNAGVVIEQLFEGNSLTWEQLIDSSQYVSFEQFKRLYAKAEHLSGSDDLALDISTISQSSAHGPLGYGAISAPTVRQMFFLI